MNNPIISIIIPCYNAEKYIVDTLDSMVNQNVNKDAIEILIVNDGSMDSSKEIVEKYILSNPKYNIRLYNKENGGLSDARNYGIEKAKGEYIWFFDADDIMESNILPIILEKINAMSLDLLTLSYREIYPQMVMDLPKVFPNKVIDGTEYLKSYQPMVSACMMIISKKLLDVNNIRFLYGVLSEDYDFTLRLYGYCNKILHLNEVSYNYIIRKGSLSRRSDDKYFEFHHASAVKTIVNLNNYLKSLHNDSYALEVKKYINRLKVSMLAVLLKSTIKNENKLKFYNNFREVGIFDIKFDKKLHLKHKPIYFFVKSRLYYPLMMSRIMMFVYR